VNKLICKKFYGVISIGIFLTLLIGASPALAMGILNLPSVQVLASPGPWNSGTLGTTIDITLAGVPSGFDVTNGAYPGWCAEDNHQPNFPPPTLVYLLDSTDSANLPLTYQGIPWDKVNYLLNNQQGTAQDVNAALWVLTGTYDGTFPITLAAQAMIDDANANGAGFIPGPGQIVAVILQGDGIGPDDYQDVIIEVEVPQEAQGCTPGYWKQEQHFGSWVGYSPGILFSEVFDRTITIKYKEDNGSPANWRGSKPRITYKQMNGQPVDLEDPTLLQALNANGGGINALARHAVAALLNANNPDVNYEYSVAQIISMVQLAIDSGDYGPTKDMLEMANEEYCPLGRATYDPRIEEDTQSTEVTIQVDSNSKNSEKSVDIDFVRRLFLQRFSQ
jgi:hypothetical protein